MAIVVPFFLIFSLFFGITAEQGYYYLSLEIVFPIIISAISAIIIGVIGRQFSIMHYLFIGAIVAVIIDSYIVRDMYIAGIIYVIAIFTTILFHKYLNNVFYIVLSVIFITGLVREYPPKDIMFEKKDEKTSFEPNDLKLAITSIANVNKKIVVHLVMDEMGALHSLPLNDERKKDVEYLSAEYKKRGFTIFEPYYSYSRDTVQSIGNLFSIESERKPNENGNEVHKLFVKEGWKVSILQNDYVHICKSESFNCKTYSFYHHVNQYQDHLKNWLVRADLWQYELLYKFANNKHAPEISIRQILPFYLYDKISPNWLNYYLRMAHAGLSRSFATPYIMDQEKNELINEFNTSSENNLAFMHLLIPHHPYILDRQCQLKPRENWDDLSEWALRDYDHLVRAYWDQYMCAHLKALELYDALKKAIPQDIEFIVQGDHGSRLRRGGPVVEIAFTYDASLSQGIKNAYFSPFIAMKLSDPSIIPTNAKTMQELVRPVLISLAKSAHQNPH